MNEKIIRNLTTKIDFLCDAEEECDFISAARSLLYYIKHNDFLSELFSSNFTSDLDLSKVICSTRAGWLEVHLPLDDEDKCSFILKFLDEVTQENSKIGLTSLLVTIYAETYISVNYIKFSERVLRPCMNLLLDKVMDYLNEHKPLQKPIRSVAPVNMTIINSSNIALGDHNHQVVSSGFDANQFRKDFTAALIQHDIDLLELTKISKELMAFSEEVDPSKQDTSRLNKLLLSIKAGLSEAAQSAFKAVAVEQVKSFLSNPAPIVSLISSIF